MSSVQMDNPIKMSHTNKKESDKSRKLFNASHKKHKHEDNRHFKFGCKRLQSFTGNGKFFPPHKRRKKEGMIIPPTKFLLGGNICDPLNLNSMQDEEVNRAMNAVTPKSSPLPTPKHKKEAIEVIIPPNICDPLNLSNCNDNDDDEYEKQLISPTKKGSKRRNRKRKRASSGSGKDDSNEVCEVKSKESVVEETPVVEESLQQETVPPSAETVPAPSSPSPQKEGKPLSLQKDKNKLRLKGLEETKDKRLRKLDVKDKIVSPVIPQPGAWKTRPQHRPSQDKKKKQQQQHQQLPNFRGKDARYQYGNYNRYYGYRNPHHDIDARLTVFARRKHLFYGKDILDIGCNIGHITLSVARDLGAGSVTGIDIDRTLINIARKNIKHYVNCVRSPVSNTEESGGDHRDSDANFFPMSMPINYGPIDIPGFTKNKSHRGFPYNIIFVQGNYVLDDDALLGSEQPQFDTILCLSVTKWIHLNFGDAGLKQAFKRMHAQLRPGGVLVLEPQGWGSYHRKKNLTERIYKNYQNIEFRPHKFTQYLLSAEVGFCKCEVVSIPPHPSKGFQRPVQLFTKATWNQGSDASNSHGKRDHAEKNLAREDIERKEYERKLFPKVNDKGNMSELSQQSGESGSQYEQLENVYAPSTTPSYDTPGRNNDNTQLLYEAEVCYADVDVGQYEKAESDVTATKSSEDVHVQSNANVKVRRSEDAGVDNVKKQSSSEVKSRKRGHDSADNVGDDASRPRKVCVTEDICARQQDRSDKSDGTARGEITGESEITAVVEGEVKRTVCDESKSKEEHRPSDIDKSIGDDKEENEQSTSTDDVVISGSEVENNGSVVEKPSACNDKKTS